MSAYFAGEGGRTRRLNLKPLGRRGAAGTIYRDLGAEGVVAKIYNSEAIAAKQRRKVAAMLARPPLLPPIRANGRIYPQIAWPIEAVSEDGRVVGFTMPEIDFTASVELEALLHRVTREADGLPEAYGFRLTVARNLAAVFAALHGQGHYVIDAKPVNLRVYRETGFIAILDCDGFFISGVGGENFPAGQYTDGYIAPEALDLPPQALGREQDQFALAVMLFQLLNNGIHPYQGRPKNDGVPPDLAGCIRARSYPYGRVEDSRQAPAGASLHRWFEDETLALFERAFLGLTRPSAAEWQQHLEGLLRMARVCAREPLTHRHFSKGCGLCALEAQRGGAPRIVNRVPPTRARGAGWGQAWGAGGTPRMPRYPPPHGAPPPASTPRPIPRPAGVGRRVRDFALVILVPGIIMVAILIGLVGITNRDAPRPSQPPQGWMPLPTPAAPNQTKPPAAAPGPAKPPPR